MILGVIIEEEKRWTILQLRCFHCIGLDPAIHLAPLVSEAQIFKIFIYCSKEIDWYTVFFSLSPHFLGEFNFLFLCCRHGLDMGRCDVYCDNKISLALVFANLKHCQLVCVCSTPCVCMCVCIPGD